MPDQPQINRLASQFDSHWQGFQNGSRERPDLGSYLKRVEQNLSSTLFEQLVGTEIRHRKKLGESVSPADFRQFGNQAMNVVADRLDTKAAAPSSASTPSKEATPTVFQQTDSSTLAGPTDRPLETGSVGGDGIGPYEFIRKLGQGGMGTVWLANQKWPVKREVALKLMREGFETKEWIARFEAERQALAMMDHPNITKVIGGGESDDGLPFYVMEYVKGDPINNYCDTKKLNIEQRLQMFATVCQAINHAHEQNVIHRDLKPENILVATYDRKPVPKLLDFGLVKTTGLKGSLTDKTIATRIGQVIGSPLYMSPEQADLDGSTIDRRSDIYSLGVILFELLVGSTPVCRADLTDQPLLKILNRVRETKTPNLVQRVNDDLENNGIAHVSQIAANRGTDVNGLKNLLGPELNRIVHKACATDPTDRYQTASDLFDAIDGLNLNASQAGSRKTETKAPSGQQAPHQSETVTQSAMNSNAKSSALSPAKHPQSKTSGVKASQPSKSTEVSDSATPWPVILLSAGLTLLAIVAGLFLRGGESDSPIADSGTGLEVVAPVTTDATEIAAANPAPIDPSVSPSLPAQSHAEPTKFETTEADSSDTNNATADPSEIATPKPIESPTIDSMPVARPTESANPESAETKSDPTGVIQSAANNANDSKINQPPTNSEKQPAAHVLQAPTSFACVLQPDALAETRSDVIKLLAQSDRDWIVIDATFDGTELWLPKDLEQIRAPRSGRKLIAYISIGEAEEYRSYWQKEWGADGKLTAEAPDWLGVENEDWEGNYPVKYWNAQWQSLILEVVDRTMASGFDGVYLDIVDGFERFEQDGDDFIDDRINLETKQSYRRDMVDWMQTISSRVHSADPVGLVIPQNGSQLLSHPDYVAAVDAIGNESIFSDDDESQPDSHTSDVVGNLDKAKAKPILLIEYPTREKAKSRAREMAAERGYVLLIAERELKTLGESGE